MNAQKLKQKRAERRRYRVRKAIYGTPERPRLSIFRSVAHIYVQVIDDASGRTVAAASSVEPTVKAQLGSEVRAGNRKGAELIGKVIADRLKEKGITRVVFDRNGFLYHGRVRSVAEAAREAGLEF